MAEQRIRNVLDGQVKGTAVQAGVIEAFHIGNMGPAGLAGAVARKKIGLVGLLYRAVVSLASCAAILGAVSKSSRSPLAEFEHWLSASGIPEQWTETVQHWQTVHNDALGSVALVLAVVGLVALPRPIHLGGDLGEAMRWRAPSTTVLALVVLVQCGLGVAVLVQLTVILVGVAWVVGPSQRPMVGRWGLVGVFVAELALAAAYLPITVLAGLFGRDEIRK